MLRYKKHKRLTDGQGSGVGVMDDADREVSSFTDRAFRSLCVAEEEQYNDIPHLPSPIRGMPLSTKYHLGIFNLSVRKTQPLAQLPTLPGQRGKWAPTFQPLLNRVRGGSLDSNIHIHKPSVHEPRGYRQRSKVSSLIKTFDNIENEQPEGSVLQYKLPVPKVSQKCSLITDEEPSSDIALNIERKLELLETDSQRPTDFTDNHRLLRRTARDVFLESQTDKCSIVSGSPCSIGSPVHDPPKKTIKQKDALKRTNFLHSENSAFESWSDLNKRVNKGEESDSSLPGTPPILGFAGPSSPLLQRVIFGARTREASLASPASTVSSSYDTVQMLRTVPPLPSKKVGKQFKEFSHRTGVSRIALETRIQEEVMQIDVESPLSSKEIPKWTKIPTVSGITKSPHDVQQEETINEKSEIISNISNLPTKINDEQVSAKTDSPKHLTSGVTDSGFDNSEFIKHQPSSGKIKTIIQQMENDSVKDVGSPCLSEQRRKCNQAPRDGNSETLSSAACVVSNSDILPQSNKIVPPWRRTKVNQKLESEEKLLSMDNHKGKPAVTSPKDNTPVDKEDFTNIKPTNLTFNITNLLTPVIRRKNMKEALEELPMMITPPPAEVLPIKEQDQKEISLYRNRDDYKSKATSLLFNLKDMRKRVKSTYNPATQMRNGNEKNHGGESRIHEEVTPSVPAMEMNKFVTQSLNESRNDIPSVKQMKGENKTDFTASSADNYLTLISPHGTMEDLAHENAEAIQETIQKETHTPEEIAVSSKCNPLEEIRMIADYPSLNLYHKEEKVSDAIKNQNLPGEEWVQKEKDFLQHEDIVIEESNQNGDWEIVQELEIVGGNTMSDYSKERDTKVEPNNQKHCNLSNEQESQRNIACEEEREMESKEDTKDELQYYAVSNSSIEDSRLSSGLENEKKKEEEKEILTSDILRDETTLSEETERPPSITMFKPNLFNFKGNKLKSSPVTKSVKLPLLRCLSEDSLFYKREKGIGHSENKGEEASEAVSALRDKNNVSTSLNNTDKRKSTLSYKEKICELLSIRPASETPWQAKTEYNHMRKQKGESENLELLKKLSSEDTDHRKAEKVMDVTTRESSCFEPGLLGMEEPFFHPLETCVSEVTGLSPECNTLLAQNVTDSMKDLVNGELIYSPPLIAESPHYSPIDNDFLQYEDAVAFSENTACSTINSPMSESVTCSMVVSPMSVNTQSSGFTTALSGLDDLPSPSSSGTNVRNGKFNFSSPEKSFPSLPVNEESQSIECTKQLQESAPPVVLQNTHASKPPAVPPKTEKALRRAKRLTKKRRKTEGSQRIQDGADQESDFVLDVPSPGNLTPTSVMSSLPSKLPPCINKILQHEESISSSSTPSFPVTQRKLLQDPDSGQYFVVDIPAHFRIKTFYDPETGKYLQLSLPPSERETPTLETLNSQFRVYPALPTLSIASIPSPKGSSEHSVPLSQENEFWEESKDIDFSKGHHYIESACDSRDQSMTGTPQSMDRTMMRSRSSDIISMKDLDDFAMEAIS
ncbi:cardiac-enriched FHL2-interacting protein [Bombina bombina]|uniref:cardiac-enriched FHL2-interacting protein n=1 Tax=Bombina bombina TaxID=8345 RepID=UPI00235B2B03|nr:cardiac-enriched FHL2-interacting protein [Bombina bombina]XP_053548164.1 cardiac-enriched FHL2-interacting protein [Bombina bombina]XP_053548165.1 cardiac-enriched FHL2-interacting protein [Bombina bombina]